MSATKFAVLLAQVITGIILFPLEAIALIGTLLVSLATAALALVSLAIPIIILSIVASLFL